MQQETYDLREYKEGIKLYNSQNTSKAQLKENFVIRLREYKKIYKAIVDAKMEHPEQAYIIQGVRGAGKTTLLARLALAVEEHEELSNWLIPLLFKEEEFGITSLFTFLERIAEELEETNPQQFEGLIDKFEDMAEANPKKAINLLDSYLNKAKKKVILFIDNLVELFEYFSKDDEVIFREILTTNSNIRLIGGSAISLEAFYDNKAPFYQFFKIVTLKGLKKKDTEALLKKLAEHGGPEEEQKLARILTTEAGKVEAIRRLTGGIPRTLVILFNILMEGPKGSTFQILEETVDQTTPLYKHRMEDLTKQQRPIVNAIALNWDAMSVKEIAEKTRIESKTVSAQLRQLERQWIIEKIPTSTKNHLYALSERFFNIWYLMRYGRRRDRKKVIWLTRFFELWCSGDELKTRSQHFMSQLTDGAHPQAALTFANALMCSDFLDYEDKQAVFMKTLNYLQNRGLEPLSRELVKIEKPDDENQRQLESLLTRYFSCEDGIQNELKKKLKTLLTIDANQLAAQKWIIDCLIKGPKVDSWTQNVVSEAIQLGIKEIRFVLYIQLMASNKFSEAIQVCEEAVNAKEECALINLASCQTFIGEYTKAKSTLNQLIEQEGLSPEALTGLAWIDIKKKETDHAVDHLNKALELESDFTEANELLAKIFMAREDYSGARVYLMKLAELGYSEFMSEIGYSYIKQNSLQGLENWIDSIDDEISATLLNDLAWDCFEETRFQKKALNFAQRAVDSDRTLDSLHTLTCIILWTEELPDATQHMETLLSDFQNELEENESDLLQLFQLFLAKGQTNLVEKWLIEYNLVERFKPLHYACMSLMGESKANELKRMGSELKETVDEILQKIEELAEKYK